jgi:hypothetical protein
VAFKTAYRRRGAVLFRPDPSVDLPLRIVQLDGYILPVMQGYFQIASFDVPPVNGEPNELALVDYIVVSRRSRDRAGLRYQRRGVGEEGNVANFVETESIMRVQVSRSLSIYSACPTEFYVAAGRPDERFQLCPAQGLEYVATLRSDSSTDLSSPQFHFTGPNRGLGSNLRPCSQRNGHMRNTQRPCVSTLTRLYHNTAPR